MRVLVTRAEPQASRTAKILADKGFDPVVLPLFEVKELAFDIPSDNFDALIFTSAQAPEILSRKQGVNAFTHLPVFCIGERTAEAARYAGFNDVRSATWNAENLVELILKGENRHLTSFYCPAAVDRAFDMASPLQSAGHSVIMQEVYKVEPIFPDQSEMGNKIRDLNNGAVLVYSARTGQHLAKVFTSFAEMRLFETMNAVAISENASRSVLQIPWRGVYISRTADEPSMMDTLKSLTEQKTTSHT